MGPSRHVFALAQTLILGMMLCARAALAQTAPPSDQTAVRQAFKFLLGSWQVIYHEDSAGRRLSTGETYSFDSIVSGGGMGGRWHFNRGTPSAPDFVDAVYYSGYDASSSRWNFYYISPRSAQYWPGEFHNGRWEFLQTFQDSGHPVQQRQWWEPVGDTLVRRHIENSRDAGKTWVPYIIVLKRITEGRRQ
jgi:hypothetical protein